MEKKAALELDGESLTINSLVNASRNYSTLSISSAAKEKILASRRVLEEMVKNGKTLYGTTTGLGGLSDTVLTESEAAEISENTVRSHASGYGDPLPIDVVRAAIISRLNTLSKGMSGVRLEVVDKIIELLNKRVTPVMYPASLGASGDLAPLAQAMLVPIGEGEAFYNGKRVPGSEALKEAGISPIRYELRDGLALINGAHLIAGLGALCVYDAQRLVKNAEIAAAMSFEALKADLRPFDERVLSARGFPGGIECAENIRILLAGSSLAGKQDRAQDAYSIRSTPQVLGAVRDTTKWVKQQVEIDLNGASDNPLFFPEQSVGTYLVGGNFQGTPIAIPLESLCVAVTIVGVLSER
ncbi:aromatic amino acid lyase, partial [archaeon]|nr:aromatic amino acid lyase [archaeon]